MCYPPFCGNADFKGNRILRTIIHIGLHIVVPAGVARLAFADGWKRAWVIMLATMAVDLDHLLADPIFDPCRCSIGFHPLHSWGAIVIYFLLMTIPGPRIIAVGLFIHMALDGLDCFWMAFRPH